MAKTLGPEWSPEQVAAGQRFADAWKRKAAAAANETAPGIGADRARVATVLARHQEELAGRPRVVAVAEGVCSDDRACIVIYVDRLGDDLALPEEIEGIPVEIVEAGEIGTLPK